MASMMGGDFAEAYVLKNAYREKMRRMDEAAAAAATKKSKEEGPAATAGERKHAVGRGGFFGLMKKKVHPKVAAPATAMEIDGAPSS